VGGGGGGMVCNADGAPLDAIVGENGGAVGGVVRSAADASERC
jgi:hypothetical protein